MGFGVEIVDVGWWSVMLRDVMFVVVAEGVVGRKALRQRGQGRPAKRWQSQQRRERERSLLRLCLLFLELRRD